MGKEDLGLLLGALGVLLSAGAGMALLLALSFIGGLILGARWRR